MWRGECEVGQQENEWHSQAPYGILQEEHMWGILLGDKPDQILGSCFVVPKLLRRRYAITDVVLEVGY
jgi:hypothetical protein